MDGALIGSLAGSMVALLLGALAFASSRRSDDRKASNDDFVAVTAGLTALLDATRAEVDRLRVEVHDCEMDKAQMRGEFETEIRLLKERLDARGA